MTEPDTSVRQTAKSPSYSTRKFFTLTLTELIEKLRHRVFRGYNKCFRKRNHIYVKKGPFHKPADEQYHFEHYDNYQDVPSCVRQAIKDYESPRSLIRDKQELTEQSIMWVAFLKQNPVGILHIRRGKAFQKWFTKLECTDIVIFMVRTFPEYRGRNIAPILINRCISDSASVGDKAFIDCRVYNYASIRSIEKAGFEYIATMKPISREDALGEKV